MIRESLIRTIERLTSEHELYQQAELGGGHDTDWSSWYAVRLLADPVFSLAEIRIAAAELAEVLEREFASFAAGPEKRWAEYIADRLLSKEPGADTS